MCSSAHDSIFVDSEAGMFVCQIYSGQGESPPTLVIGGMISFGSKTGILRYLGTTQFSAGHWAGVELMGPQGRNDGSVQGIRYFKCAPNHERQARRRSSAPQIDQLSSDLMPALSIPVGSMVIVGGSKRGCLRYLGNTEFATGIWAGVELDGPTGKNDGSVNGSRYFSCPPKHGLFCPPNKLSRLSPPTPSSTRASKGGKASRRRSMSVSLLPGEMTSDSNDCGISGSMSTSTIPPISEKSVNLFAPPSVGNENLNLKENFGGSAITLPEILVSGHSLEEEELKTIKQQLESTQLDLENARLRYSERDALANSLQLANQELELKIKSMHQLREESHANQQILMDEIAQIVVARETDNKNMLILNQAAEEKNRLVEDIIYAENESKKREVLLKETQLKLKELEDKMNNKEEDKSELTTLRTALVQAETQLKGALQGLSELGAQKTELELTNKNLVETNNSEINQRERQSHKQEIEIEKLNKDIKKLTEKLAETQAENLKTQTALEEALEKKGKEMDLLVLEMKETMIELKSELKERQEKIVKQTERVAELQKGSAQFRLDMEAKDALIKRQDKSINTQQNILDLLENEIEISQLDPLQPSRDQLQLKLIEKDDAIAQKNSLIAQLQDHIKALSKEKDDIATK
eukprot:Ihof_evm6s264 gene=Ihof_evmTU6s264